MGAFRIAYPGILFGQAVHGARNSTYHRTDTGTFTRTTATIGNSATGSARSGTDHGANRTSLGDTRLVASCDDTKLFAVLARPNLHLLLRDGCCSRRRGGNLITWCADSGRRHRCRIATVEGRQREAPGDQ